MTDKIRVRLLDWVITNRERGDNITPQILKVIDQFDESRGYSPKSGYIEEDWVDKQFNFKYNINWRIDTTEWTAIRDKDNFHVLYIEVTEEELAYLLLRYA